MAVLVGTALARGDRGPGLPGHAPRPRATAGAFALEQGQIIPAMLLCALLASGCAWIGVIHAWRFIAADTVLQLGWGVGGSWALGQLLMAVVFALAHLARRG